MKYIPEIFKVVFLKSVYFSCRNGHDAWDLESVKLVTKNRDAVGEPTPPALWYDFVIRCKLCGAKQAGSIRKDRFD